jgi:hypothetical protein
MHPPKSRAGPERSNYGAHPPWRGTFSNIVHVIWPTGHTHLVVGTRSGLTTHQGGWPETDKSLRVLLREALPGPFCLPGKSTQRERPDDVRHTTSYVSNARGLKRELEALDAMVRADRLAIHELYMLDGMLVRRYVPQGVSLP